MAQVAPQQQQASPPMQQPRDNTLAETANQAGAGNTTNNTPSGGGADGTSSRNEEAVKAAKKLTDCIINDVTSGMKGADLKNMDAGAGGSQEEKSSGGAGQDTSEKPDETPTAGAPSNKSEGKGQNRARGRRGGRYRSSNRQGQGGGGAGSSGGQQRTNRGNNSERRSKFEYKGGNSRGGGGAGGDQNLRFSPRVLHVSAQSPVKQVAGAIAWISREGECPKILATAAPAINQAVKACAIARQFMQADKIEVSVYPEYTRGRRRDADSFTFDLRKSVTRYQVVVDESMQELKVSKDSKAPTVAGAIAGRVREGQRVILSAIGPLSVAAAVRSVAIARQYLAEDGVDISFRPSFMNIEFSDGRKSSCLNFQLLAQQV